ncbi:ATP-dependent RNA helicase DeaD [Salirhabdus euzebyi]|uniref:RNA helicase n=1 Tax=Salirhabdus euzebyi TaxID=394506 RepID=A0A841Q328_9BACI|nr:DEAD/DEAH box helicase [Salirhabdus euzebyi]MBB6452358.1 ATP-dependent RNA helicase DeaD [Salirhabdus euzebyi]
MKNFTELGLQENLYKKLFMLGIEKPTAVQERAIPSILEGNDVLGQAQTGTGKTLAFVLPILQKIDPSEPHIQALILAPTRELAIQITEEINKLITYKDGLEVLAVYGGQDVDKQLRKLKGATQIVVATPGRLLDHLRRGTIDLSKISMLVLDEADQMLNMGFLQEVEDIIKKTNTERQMMLFSATMPQEVRTLSKRYMKKPEDIRIKETKITVEDIDQLVVETTDRTKQMTLRNLLDEYRPFLAIIFCRTKRRAKTLNDALQTYGYNSDELHGDLSQAKREKVTKQFREAKLQFLVATDVAARGLDIEGVTHVFNYDIPEDVESYIHRIGRTGRAGQRGMAITLVAPKDNQSLQVIEKGIKMSINRKIVQKTEQNKENEGNNESKPNKRRPRTGFSKQKQTNPRNGKNTARKRDNRNRSR